MSNPKGEHIAVLTPRPDAELPGEVREEPALTREPPPPAAPQNLAPIIKAIHAVMAAVPFIGKTGKNAHAGWAYASEADVLAAIRPAMVANGLVLIPNVIKMEHEQYTTAKNNQGTRAFVTVEHTLAHISGAVWPEKVTAVGCAEDTQDKAVAQAGTSAQKYCLLRLFIVETGQDSDKGNAAHAQPRAAPAQNSPESSNAPAQTQPQGQAANRPQNQCPKCGKDAIIKGQEQYGGGWTCWKKRDGCGAKFTVDPSTMAQEARDSAAVMRVPHETPLKWAARTMDESDKTGLLDRWWPHYRGGLVAKVEDGMLDADDLSAMEAMWLDRMGPRPEGSEQGS